MQSLALNRQPFFPILQGCKSQDDVKRAHALSLRTGAFDHPSISARLLSLYAVTVNHLPYAATVFSLLPNPDLVSYNVLLKCHVTNHRSHDSLALFCDLVREFVPDGFTLPSVIKSCARLGAASEGSQVHGLALKLGLGSDKFVQSSLVSMYSRLGEIGCAREVFDEMPHRDLVLWNCLVDGYARCGEVERALEVFNEMPERDSFSWSCLVNGFSKSGMIAKAWEVFDRMPDRNRVSWNAMIDGCMKSGEVEMARELFGEMSVGRDLITWNSMIAGYGSNGRFSDAVRLFGAMMREGLVPNDTTFVAALSSAAGSAVLGAGKSLHSHLIRRGIRTEGVLGTSLIDMYSKCGDAESALAVFESIPRKKPSHYTAAIVGLGAHGMARRAHELFSTMRNESLLPHPITCLGVLTACSHSGSVDLGRSFFDLMARDFKIQPSIEHYECLVDMLSRAGNLEEAIEMVENMPEKPNKVVLMSLLSGARIHRDLAAAEYAARRLAEISPDFDAAAGKREKVASIRELMKKQGIKKKPGRSFVEHRGELHEFVMGDKSHPRTREIYSKMDEMRERLRSAGHVPDTTQVLPCLDDEAKKESEIESHSERLAIAFGLINSESPSPVRVIKNLRVCSDCHSVTKLLSKIYDREIIVRDNSRYHHFKNGFCSCNDFLL